MYVDILIKFCKILEFILNCPSSLMRLRFLSKNFRTYASTEDKDKENGN